MRGTNDWLPIVISPSEKIIRRRVIFQKNNNNNNKLCAPSPNGHTDPEKL